MKYLSVILIVILAGCSIVSPRIYTGVVVDSQGLPIANAAIEAWGHEGSYLIPFNMAGKIGEYTANEHGEFVVNTNMPVHFFQAEGGGYLELYLSAKKGGLIIAPRKP